MTEAVQNSRTANEYASLDAATKAAVDVRVAEELRTNRYDAATGVLQFTHGQTLGWQQIVDRYGKQFAAGDAARSLPKGALLPPQEGGLSPDEERKAATQFAAFITWTAWLSAAKRPEANHSYTNNWPYDPAAGNGPTSGALVWSAVSVGGLIFFLAVILYFQHRYRLEAVDVQGANLRLDPASLILTPSQRATAKFFVVALLLFLVQALLGG